jgi:transcription initiation factor TFIIIB Brf1 subunit/transcription initiation factor TFIIB
VYIFLMKLTQQDMARILGVTTVTIRNWRKEKPNLYKIIMQGFAFEEAIESAKENYEKLEALKEKVSKK